MQPYFRPNLQITVVGVLISRQLGEILVKS